MPRYIIKLSEKGADGKEADFYLEWSTITCAPLTFGMPLDKFKKYYEKKYGSDSPKMKRLPELLARVKETCCSEPSESLEGLLASNHAGPNKRAYTRDEIFRLYCVEQKE